MHKDLGTGIGLQDSQSLPCSPSPPKVSELYVSFTTRVKMNTQLTFRTQLLTWIDGHKKCHKPAGGVNGHLHVRKIICQLHKPCFQQQVSLAPFKATLPAHSKIREAVKTSLDFILDRKQNHSSNLYSLAVSMKQLVNYCIILFLVLQFFQEAL